MKSSFVIQTLLAVVIPTALANPIDVVARYMYGSYCRSTKCYQALERDPIAASSTCSDILGRTAPTIIVTAYRFINTTAITTATETMYQATSTTVVLATTEAPVLLDKRYGMGISEECDSNLHKFRAACSCIIGFEEPTPTTITTTIPSTLTDAVATETVTTNVPGTLTITSTCSPAATAAIQNGGFETGDISPWYIVPGGSDTMSGTYSIVTDATTPNPAYAFMATVSMPLGAFSYTKVNIAQNLVTCSGASYNLAFNYRFEGSSGAACYIVVFIDGVKVHDITSGPSTWTPAPPVRFTATSSSAVLRVDLVMGKAAGTENLYIDGFTVDAA
ncbi:hypothetical protein TWF281_009584 [Arthrobotrys megalospora]